jgi:hypothetical protein
VDPEFPFQPEPEWPEKPKYPKELGQAKGEKMEFNHHDCGAK